MENKSVQAETFTLGFLAGLLGYALAVVWACSFFLFESGPLHYCKQGDPRFVVCAYALCVALFFGISHVLHDRINTPRGLVVSFVIGVVAVVAYEALFFSPVLVVPAALALVVLLQFWTGFFCRFTQTRIYVAITTMFCGICVVLSAYLDPVASFTFTQSLPILSMAILFLKVRRSLGDWISVERRASESRFVVSTSSLAAVCSDGLFTGLIFYFVVNAGSPSPSVMIVVSLILLGAGAVFLADSGKGRLREEVLLKSYALRFAPFLLALPFLDGIAVNICTCAMLVSAAFNVSMVVSAHIERVRFNQLSSLCIFGYSFTLFFLFAALGWAIPLALDVFSASMPVRAFALYGILVVLIAVSTYLFEDQYPSEVVEGAALKVEEIESAAATPLRSATREISEVYGLSPRQTEVFELLAKGRNSEFISKEFYISRATAKAHINTIYKKIGVHSQQELLNLVEEIARNGVAKH